MGNIKEHVRILKSGSPLVPGNESDFPFPAHAASHESGGSDEIDLDSIDGTLDATKLTGLDSTLIPVLSLPDTPATTLREVNNKRWSSGIYEDAILGASYLTYLGTTLTVEAGRGAIRKTDDVLADLYECDWPLATQALSLGDIYYVGIEYDAVTDRGKAVFKLTDSFNGNDEFRLGSVTRDSVGVHILNNPAKAGNAIHDAYHRLYETLPFHRADRPGGIILGEIGTRNLTLSAGEIYDGLNEFVITAKDTSAADTFDYYYRDGAGGWTASTAQTQWNMTQYDDGTGALATLGAAKWGVHWAYIDLDDDLVLLFGQAEYLTESAALNSSPPSTVPNRILIHGKLIGRIVFQKSIAPAEHIESVFTTMFSASGVTDHNELANIGTTTHTAIDAFLSTPNQVNVGAGGSIVSTANGDIAITPNGTGIINLNATTYPKSVKDTVTVASASYTVLTTDGLIRVTYTITGPVTVTVPSALIAISGFEFEVKDSGQNAATNNITIETQGAETIDGETNAVINGDGDSVRFRSDGTNLEVI